jgi:F-type H+-transporting ATPase subunit alpha
MSTNTIVEEIRKNISLFQKETTKEETGKVIEVGDGIARLSGLTKCQAGEMLEFIANGETTYGLALNLEEETVGCVLLGEYRYIKEGDTVKRTNRILSVPVGEELIGRVVNPLGQSIDR